MLHKWMFRVALLAGALGWGLAAPLSAEEAQAGSTLKGRFGLGLSAGLSQGNRAWTATDDPSDQLTADWGSGFTWNGQLFYGVGQDLEAGLGVFSPLGYTVSRSGAFTDGSGPYTYKSEAKMSGLPIIAGLRYHAPTASKLGFFGGIGVGWFTGGEETGSESRDYAPTSIFTDQSRTNASTYGGGIAYRSELGAEYHVTRSFSLELGFGLLVYPLTPISSSSSSVSITQAGAPAGRWDSKTTYKDGPAKPKAPVTTYVDNRVAGTGTTVQTADYGDSVQTYTNHYLSGSFQYSDNASTREAPLETLWMTQLSTSLAAVLRF